MRAEWEDLEARRTLRRLEAQVRETERRCDALIESSRDPIAYVHEGMHIRANTAYLEMFGFESFDDVEGMSLLDLVAPQHVDGFKQLLKGLSKGEAPPPRYELEARDVDGSASPPSMEFTPALYEGEPCVQVVLRRQESDPELAREVEELRQRDQVTGLLNRPTFLRALEDAVADAAQNHGQHGLLLLEPDHYQRLLQDIGLDSADAIAGCDRRAPARGARRRCDRRALRRTQLRRAAAQRRPRRDQRTGRAHPRGDGRARGPDRRALQRHHGQHRRRADRREDRQRHARCWPRPTRACSRRRAWAATAPRSSTRAPSTAPKKSISKPGSCACATRSTTNGFMLHYQPVISLQGEPARSTTRCCAWMPAMARLVPPMAFLQIAEEHGLLWEIDR